MAGRLQDKVAIVTGASSGLGRAIALAYAKEGASVVCADLQQASRAENPKELEHTTDEAIRVGGGKSIFVKADVSSAADIEALVQSAVAEFSRVDILVNNAGIGGAPLRIHELPEESWDREIDINLKSIFLGAKFAVTQMLKQEPHSSGDRGWIINIASVLGLVSIPHAAAYHASKGGVVSLTRHLGLSYAPDKIHCNAICPGWLKTQILADASKHADLSVLETLHPLKGIGNPEDVTGAAIFLASDEARWVTGVSMAVDGGYIAK